ncbi:hypothetical protein ACIRNY_01760 [Capnocytophaga canimorsus]|uniref:hypothetical protein n=1 Tax=Capnocytophaga canimorsus TaxID=28188 RepID=UPI00384FB858
MITNVLQNNKTLYIYDEDDQLSAKIMLHENDFLGAGTDFFVLKKTYTMLTEDNQVYEMYDKFGKTLGSILYDKAIVFKSVVGTNINFQRANKMESYDKFGTLKSVKYFSHLE